MDHCPLRPGSATKQLSLQCSLVSRALCSSGVRIKAVLGVRCESFSERGNDGARGVLVISPISIERVRPSEREYDVILKMTAPHSLTGWGPSLRLIVGKNVLAYVNPVSRL